MLRKYIMVNWQQQIGYEMTQQRVLRSTISQLVYQSVYPGLKISKLKIKDILLLLNHSVSSKIHFLSEDKACIFSSLFIDTRKSIAFHQLTNIFVCRNSQYFISMKIIFEYHFDLFEIRGGLSGLASSKAAVQLREKVGLADFVVPSPQSQS
ncbi:unnamed protein product [Paramecium primaurelia]|uniref:Uncharacterized protein n=1 Tax=Paramecium primaurelia TaxID=5886 RepID=A0A8S1PHA7_PARPR|nr:unnamed protein product [Paramecium primaurelia]